MMYFFVKYAYFYCIKPTKDLTKYVNGQSFTWATSNDVKNSSDLSIRKKLQRVQNDLKEKYKVEVIHDFCVADRKVVTEFQTKLEVKSGDLTSGGGIGVLIDSVGIASAILADVHKMNQEEIRQMLYINDYDDSRASHDVP